MKKMQIQRENVKVEKQCYSLYYSRKIRKKSYSFLFPVLKKLFFEK